MKNIEHTEIENTRERLKLNHLEKTTRKDLFDKFVNAGGEVMNPPKKPIKRNAPILNKDKANGNNLNKSKQEENLYKRNSKTKKSANNAKANSAEDQKNNLFANIALWFEAYSSGLISLSGGKVNPKFLNFIDKTVTASLLEMDSYMFSALNPYSENPLEAVEKKEQVLSVFEKDPENLEILERIKNQYNERAYKSFLKPFKELNSPVIASSYVNELRDMFKPLYVLKLYTDRMKSSAEKALIKYSIVDNMSKELVNSRITNFKKDVDIIYNKYYHKLLILLQYAAKEKLEQAEDCMRFLNITDEDLLGYYTKLKEEAEKMQEKRIEEVKENIGKNVEDNDKLSKIENIGINLIEKVVSFKKQHNNINYETDPFYSVDELDKIYRIKVLIDFLDVEYSVLFVSNKVKYTPIYDNNERKDYKESFNNIFLSLSDLNSRFNEYSSVCKNISKIEEDATIKHEHKVSILAEKNSERTYLAKNIKSNVIELITTLKNMLDTLLLDKEEREKIISNPTDIITLSEISGNSKRIQGYDVMKALTEAYYFISGFYKLITRGELYGAGLLIDLPNTKKTENKDIIKE